MGRKEEKKSINDLSPNCSTEIVMYHVYNTISNTGHIREHICIVR